MLIKTAGISKHITFHRFRDTFAMRLLDNGIDIYTIATLLGHKQVSSTQIYVRTFSSESKESLDEIEVNKTRQQFLRDADEFCCFLTIYAKLCIVRQF